MRCKRDSTYQAFELFARGVVYVDAIEVLSPVKRQQHLFKLIELVVN